VAGSLKFACTLYGGNGEDARKPRRERTQSTAESWGDSSWSTPENMMYAA